jgi:hypothetical protein
VIIDHQLVVFCLARFVVSEYIHRGIWQRALVCRSKFASQPSPTAQP